MTIQEVEQMITEVENYIFVKKNQRVKIDLFQIITDNRQLQMLIHAHKFTK